MSDKYSEQVFDYLMEEMLKGPKPPDLGPRIEAAWHEEKTLASKSKSMVSAELVGRPKVESDANSSQALGSANFKYQ